MTATRHNISAIGPIQRPSTLAEEIADDFTAIKSYIHMVDCSSAARTVTPPDNPGSGDAFTVVDSRGQSGTNTVTIDFIAVAQKLYGNNQNWLLSQDGRSVMFFYVNDTIGWITDL